MEDGNPKSNNDTLDSGGFTALNRHKNRHYRFDVSGVYVKIMILLVVIGLSCIVLNHPTQLFQRSSSYSSSVDADDTSDPEKSGCGLMKSDQQNLSTTYTKEEIEELKSTLKKAAMGDNKTVIITALNAAWTEPDSIFDLFLESFRIGHQTQNLLNHVVVAALDGTAYSRCLAAHLHCFALTTAGVNFSGEALFMSEDYLSMMWRRIDFLRVVLELGYNFVFSDADVMWLRDPFTRFYPNADFQIACDHYWYNSTDLDNSPNGGFNFVKSNKRTISFYKFWYNGRNYFPGTHDQEVLNMIKADPYVKNLGMEMRFLNTAYYSGFCEPSKDLDLVITMHANCCIGLEDKIHDIQVVIDDWKRYMALPPDAGKNVSGRSWTVPRRCY